MPLEDFELGILTCMYKKKIIGSSHRRVDSIAGLCHVRDKKGFKKTLRKLAKQNYLNQWHGPAYSLTPEAVTLVEEHLGLR
jgi:hypothetical protein